MSCSQKELLELHRVMTDANRRVHAARAMLAEALKDRADANENFNLRTGCHWDRALVYGLDSGNDKSFGYVSFDAVQGEFFITITDGTARLFRKEGCQDRDVLDTRGDLFWFNEIPAQTVTINLKEKW